MTGRQQSSGHGLIRGLAGGFFKELSWMWLLGAVIMLPVVLFAFGLRFFSADDPEAELDPRLDGSTPSFSEMTRVCGTGAQAASEDSTAKSEWATEDFQQPPSFDEPATAEEWEAIENDPHCAIYRLTSGDFAAKLEVHIRYRPVPDEFVEDSDGVLFNRALPDGEQIPACNLVEARDSGSTYHTDAERDTVEGSYCLTSNERGNIQYGRFIENRTHVEIELRSVVDSEGFDDVTRVEGTAMLDAVVVAVMPKLREAR